MKTRWDQSRRGSFAISPVSATTFWVPRVYTAEETNRLNVQSHRLQGGVAERLIKCREATANAKGKHPSPPCGHARRGIAPHLGYFSCLFLVEFARGGSQNILIEVVRIRRHAVIFP